MSGGDNFKLELHDQMDESLMEKDDLFVGLALKKDTDAYWKLWPTTLEDVWMEFLEVDRELQRIRKAVERFDRVGEILRTVRIAPSVDHEEVHLVHIDDMGCPRRRFVQGAKFFLVVDLRHGNLPVN